MAIRQGMTNRFRKIHTAHKSRKNTTPKETVPVYTYVPIHMLANKVRNSVQYQ